MTEQPTVAEAATAWRAAGVSVIPARADGTKAPMGSWKAWTTALPEPAEVEHWFTGGYPGVGLVCGAVSGGLEMLELEGRAVEAGAVERLSEHITAAGLAELWQRLVFGYCEATPSGGLHLLYRVTGEPVPGNTKLARRPATAAELELDPKDRLKVLAETRGEGGFVVVAPSHGPVHPSGQPWVILAGQPGVLPTITAAERTELHRLVRLLDEMPLPSSQTRERVPGEAKNGAAPDQHRRDSASAMAGPTSVRIGPAPASFNPPARPSAPAGYVSPGDDFEAREDWSASLLLGGAGWHVVSGRPPGYRTWRRPGKREGISATTGTDPLRDRLFVFSTSTEFEAEQPYTKLGAYAVLHHGGDHTAAAQALKAMGYGTPAQPQPPTGPAPTLNIGQPGQDVTAALVLDVAAAQLAQMTAVETLRMRARQAAQNTLRAEAAAALPVPEFIGLPALLAEPDEPVLYRVDELWPRYGRVMLSAQAKAGKTTLRDNLVRSLADGKPFLDRFTVQPVAGTLVVLDVELSRANLRRWLQAQGIEHGERVTVVPLRGAVASLNLFDDTSRAEWAARIRAAHGEILLLDCLGPVLAAFGLNEKENADVGRFLVAFEALLREADIDEAFVIHHMGHTNERGRGASRLRDWPDAEWRLVKDEEDTETPDLDPARYLAAKGRDVELAETQLRYEIDSHRLSTTAIGTRREARASKYLDVVTEYVRANPGQSMTKIERGTEGATRDGAREALAYGIAQKVFCRHQPNGRDTWHYLRSECPDHADPADPAIRAMSRDQLNPAIASIGDAGLVGSGVIFNPPATSRCPCGKDRHSPGDLGPCPRCGTKYHRYGGGRLPDCPSCHGGAA
jgi:hypothetical protein